LRSPSKKIHGASAPSFAKLKGKNAPSYDRWYGTRGSDRNVGKGSTFAPSASKAERNIAAGTLS
jgi:hypothetical protein